jgi:hypothetical protein
MTNGCYGLSCGTPTMNAPLCFMGPKVMLPSLYTINHDTLLFFMNWPP